jgi:mono/diheme cytochrome c family protein
MIRTSLFAAALLLAPLVAHAETGDVLYQRTCSACHQPGGKGVPGAFPRLAGRANAIAAVPQGRKAMISVVLYGISGTLSVDHQSLSGVMPGFGQLKDDEIAAVLTYVSHLEGKPPKAFTSAEVAKVRAGAALSPSEVNALARDPAVVKAAP